MNSMNPEIVAAMRQVRQMMGEEMTRDERRVAALLADLLGNQYPGERRLLKDLVVMGIPRMIADGRMTEADLSAKAAFVAQKYFWNEGATLEAVRAWCEVLQQEAPKPRLQPEKPQSKIHAELDELENELEKIEAELDELEKLQADFDDAMEEFEKLLADVKDPRDDIPTDPA